jgi:ABC-type branched-subunit amino acid transport system substrate-binding protein
LIVKDDKGTAEGARAATQEAIGEGAQIILGPLFAPAVVAAGEVAKPAGRPIIAFSTDANAGSKGVYLLSFMVEPEVERIVGYAASQGIRSFAALAPESAYGNVATAAFQQSVAAAGGSIAALERFPDDRTKLEAPIEKIMAVAGANPKAQALFLPADAQVLSAIAPLLGQKGFDPARVRPLGTGVWNDPAAFRLKELQGGWFAAPDSSGFNNFAARYRARYNANPTRIATLSYDAVSLAVALGRSQGARAYAEETLTNPSGFSGADGVFRFRPTGGNDRGLAVLAVRNGATQVVSAAPQGFQGA